MHTSNKKQNAVYTNSSLTPLECYNSQVLDNLKQNPLSFIQQHAIKLFNDNCQRNKFTETEYNTEVDKFNKQHGLLLVKKITDTVKKSDPGLYYSYINYPYIDSTAYSVAMKNYRAEIKRYNDSLIAVNHCITKYNSTLKKELTSTQLKLIASFKKINEKLFTKNYNIEVEKFNQVQGKILRKKKVQPVKYQTEMIFSILLGFYSKQLKQRNSYLMEMGKSTAIDKNALPLLKIDYLKLSNHKIDGFQRLDVCKKTTQNHVRRLREAGVLVNYIFVNSKQPVKCQISSKIVSILDGNSPKQLIIENQTVNGERGKDLHNNSDTTRAFLLKEDKIKDSASKVNFITSQSPIAPKTSADSDFYKNTPKIVNEIQTGGGEKITEISENLRKLLVPPHILAQQLANNEFLTYTPLRKDRLLKEIQYGNLDNEEFKQLIVYDILKSSTKIYKNSHVFAGEWTNAIKNALNSWFINRNFTLQKNTIYNKIPQYRWQLEFARKWFKKSEVKPLFPAQYFSKTRTLSKEIGFFGLEKIYKKNQSIKLQELEQQKADVRNSNLRKERLTYLNKAEKKVKQFVNGKIKETDLYNYFQNNLPNNWLAQLPNLIEKEFNSKKTA